MPPRCPTIRRRCPSIRRRCPSTARLPIGWTVAVAIFLGATLAGGCRRPEAESPESGTAESPANSPLESPVQGPPETNLAPSTEPLIRLEVTGPDEAPVGEKISVNITVANSGKTPADGLSIRAILDTGLELVDRDQRLQRDLGNVAPGQSQSVEIEIRATRPGPLSHTVEVVRSDRVLASEWTVVTATPREVDTSAAARDDSIDSDEEPAVAPEPKTPLGYEPDELQLLHPRYPVWVTRDCKSVVLLAIVCQRQAPLETFACLRGTKEHESVVVVNTAAYVVHAGLEATGARAGSPVRFVPEYAPARGPEIEITMIFQDAEGQIQRARGQDWVRDARTRQPMQHPWVFAGSHFIQDEETGESYYQADGQGALVCVSNFSSAVLDVPVASSDSAASLLFEAFTERIPPLGTPVTMVLTPKVDAEPR